VVRDLEENHGRKISKKYIQTIVGKVGQIMRDKEVKWTYATPPINEATEMIAVGRDGTTTLIKQEGWRQTMVGTLSLYGQGTKRQHSVYMACSPEKGKATFDYLLDREIEQIKNGYPDSTIVGLGDGAKDNWTFLGPRTDVQILDYYHACENLSKYSEMAFNGQKARHKWKAWSEDQLLNRRRGVQSIIKAMNHSRATIRGKTNREKMGTIIAYFQNNRHRMKYKKYISMGYPIGSGVTEAACKVIVKQRLCCSGMRWSRFGADDVLLARGLRYSDGRWNQFWLKFDQYGFSFTSN